jgi:metal-responsive CopG/Arc/MetJ family transcriptional regulator
MPLTKKRNKRRFQKHQDVVLGVRVYIPATLLQRVEDALAKSGAGDRSGVICALLDTFATSRGC